MKRLRKLTQFIIVAALLVCLVPIAAFAATEAAEEEEFPNAIGEVIFLMGTVTAQQPDGTSRILDLNKQVIPGDVIITGRKSSVEIALKDESIYAQGPDSTTTLDEFVYTSEQDASKMLFTMGLGTFRYVTGKIVKSNPDAFALDTPSTTIGIRGTEIVASLTPTQEVIGNIELTPGQTMSVGAQTIDRSMAAVSVDPKTGEVSAPQSLTPEQVKELIKNTPLTTKGETGPAGATEEDLERKVDAFKNQINRTKGNLGGVDGRPNYGELHVLSMQQTGQKTAESERDSGGSGAGLGGGGEGGSSGY